jgi:hypothetical protein
LKGRLPTLDESSDSVQDWQAAIALMHKAMTAGVFEPFKQALEKGLIVHGSTLQLFEQQASALPRNRRMLRADGAPVRDAAAGDAKFSEFLDQMQLVAKHIVEVSRLSLHDAANSEMSL